MPITLFVEVLCILGKENSIGAPGAQQIARALETNFVLQKIDLSSKFLCLISTCY